MAVAGRWSPVARVWSTASDNEQRTTTIKQTGPPRRAEGRKDQSRASIGHLTQLRLVVWLVIGLAIYFGYGRKHSKVQNPVVPKEVGTPERQMAD